MSTFSQSTAVILNEARKRGIKVEVIHPRKAVLLKKGDHEEYFFYQFSTNTSAVAHQACKHKDVARSLLARKGISVAKGQAFLRNELNDALIYFRELKKPVVIKPTDSAHGHDVLIGIKSEDDFVKAWKKIARHSRYILVEEMFLGGTEYRILATSEKIIGVLNRVPANVIGDGVHTIRELIKIKNKDPRRAKDASFSDTTKSLVRIKIDNIVKNILSEAGLELNSIIKKGQRVFLRKNSNISTGGDSIDFTDKIHPSVKKIAIEAIKSIPGLAYGGIDFMTKDITKKQDKGDYIIIEMNVSPGLDIHHFPYEGKPRDVAKEIIDIAFPETKAIK